MYCTTDEMGVVGIEETAIGFATPRANAFWNLGHDLTEALIPVSFKMRQ
jgi:hypothetical protein